MTYSGRVSPKLHKSAHIAALVIILLLGFAVRSINLSFPSIGYHNLNENECLTAAQEMKRAGGYSINKTYCRNIFQAPADEYRSQFPLVSYQVLLAWKFFDENLWGPRIFNVLFGVLSVLSLYFISFILFRDQMRALFASLLLAIMPLAVFFSRNLQSESPAFFFMILSNLFYLRFAEFFKRRDLFISGLSLSLAGLYNFNFIITLVPYVVCFPFKRCLKEKKNLLSALFLFLFSLIPLTIIIIWMGYSDWHGLYSLARIKPFDIFTAAYWAGHGRQIWWYARQENFTIIYIALALSGIVAAFFRSKGLVNRYIIGWTAALALYGILHSRYLFENNFSQMPFLILVCVSAVYAVSSVSELLKRYLRRDLFLVYMLIAVSISAPLVCGSIARMFQTAFWGADVAGESLRELTRPGEYIFLSTHAQGYGIVRYSQRMAGWTEDIGEFRKKERDLSVEYACFYPIENLFQLKSQNPALFSYIEKNYHIKEVGLTEEPLRLYYIILQKGEGQDMEKSLSSLSGAKRIRTIYKPFGRERYVFFYSLTPALKEPKGAAE